MKIIHEHIVEIRMECENHFVEELYAFGSVLTDSFRKDSDVDLLVRFGQVNPQDYFDNYMDFKEKMEQILQRQVDLLEIQTLNNPILKRSVECAKRLIYERADSKIFV